MAYKQKINPRTGKFDMVSPNEGVIKNVTSADKSVEVTPSGDGIDLSVPLVTEQNHGRERKFDKLVRDHSFMNSISVDSSNSYQNGEEANASLMDTDPEYYPVAGQMVEYINKTDGHLHIARYTGNFLIDRDGSNEYWCGATFDLLNKCWLINRNVSGAAKLRVARSASGLFWQISDYEASSSERRVMICSTSYASLIMSGNQSQEYDITYDGGDSLWQHLTVPKNLRYRSVKRAFIKIGGEVKEVFLFNENNSVHALDESHTFTTLISSTNSLLYRIGGHNVSPYPSNGLCDETEWFVDKNEKNNVLILWNQNPGNPDLPYNITWLREAETELGWEEVTTYSVPTDYLYRLMTIHYENGKIYAYSGERSENTSRNACSLNVGTESITFGSRYENTTHLIPTFYGLVQVKGAYRQVFVEGEEITMPEGVVSGAFYSVAYDGEENVLLVTGGTQYGDKKGNYGLILNVAKKSITNNNSWEEIGIITEEHEGIITAKDGKVKSAQLDEYLHYDKTKAKLSTKASDRTTAYANYLCLGTDTEDGWCPVALADIVDNSTKLYSDEACTVEWGTITAHQYNPNNPEDLAVTINGVSHRFIHVADKIPESLATTKALLSLTPQSSGMTQSADNATDEAFHNLAEHLELADPKLWEQKTWSGLSGFYGVYIWTDGTEVYSSAGSYQYMLDKSTSTWNVKTWSGLTAFEGPNIWTDGTNIYYSYGSYQYMLDKSTSTWTVKTWSGFSSFFDGSQVWTDGTNLYYSNGSDQYVLDKSTSTWNVKTWSGLSSFFGTQVWTDGTDIFYSFGSDQYVLDKSTSTWNVKTWNGLTEISGPNVWNDGTNIYYSNGSIQYILNKVTSTWHVKTWNGITTLYGSNIWSDGTNKYYSAGDLQYVLNPVASSESEFAFRRSSSDTWQKIKMSDIERYINARQRPLIYLDGYDFYMGMFPKRADFIMRGDSYNINFHITSFDSYTQDNPFRVFGNMSSDGGSYMYFEEGNGEGGGRSFSFGSWETQWHDWMSSLFMFEFWMVDSSHARLRVTEYPNGYDGIAGRSEVIDVEYEEVH